MLIFKCSKYIENVSSVAVYRAVLITKNSNKFASVYVL